MKVKLIMINVSGSLDSKTLRTERFNSPTTMAIVGNYWMSLQSLPSSPAIEKGKEDKYSNS
jgi:hypothetical protein